MGVLRGVVVGVVALAGVLVGVPGPFGFRRHREGAALEIR